MPAVPLPEGSRLEVVVVGAVGAHKGSRVLLSLARDAQSRGLPIRYRVVGYTDVTEELKAAGVEETGRYGDDAEAAALVAAVAPSCILLPSIWPETFCYTLSLAFGLGVPPVVFDLGAQAQRVRDAGFGHVLPPAAVDDPSGLNDRLLALPLATLRAEPRRAARIYPDVLRDYYGLDVPSASAAHETAAGRPTPAALDRAR